MNEQTSKLFNFETFGTADFQTVRRFGFSDIELREGLYGEEVSKGNIVPELEHTIRSL